MSEEAPENKQVCIGKDCSNCPLDDAEPSEGQLRGGRLVLAAAIVFLLPLSLAIAGGVLAGALGWISAAGAAIGAAAGVLLALAARGRLFMTGEDI